MTSFHYPAPIALIFMMNETHSSHLDTLFRFCAQSLRYPESGWFTNQYLESVDLLLEALGANQEREAIRFEFSRANDPLEQLQIEYTRLFINGVPHVVAPPYGSVYLDRSLQGPHTEKTRNFYRQYGYDLAEPGELPDHIVHQLEFLALLTARGEESARVDFLKTIFFPWFSIFATRVRQESNHPFYSVIVQLIDYLTKEDDEDGIQRNEA